MRNVPVRMYLPDGPILQELAPPVLEDGLCLVIFDTYSFISKLLPL